MMRHLRVIDTGQNSARWNTAMSAALLENCAREPGADVLRFYRFPRSVLLGASEVPTHAVDLNHCARRGIEVARRITGGGAVYMSPSMLAWDFVTRRSASNASLSETIGQALARALKTSGLAASFLAPNSLIVEGRKISGAATSARGGVFLHQGTLLLQDEIAEMSAALGAPADLLRAHVTSFENCGVSVPTCGAMQAFIAEAIAHVFGLTQVASGITALEIDATARELARELGTDAHVLGTDWHLAGGVPA